MSLNCQTFVHGRQEVIFNRLRIGHTYTTHRFSISQNIIPLCKTCNQLLIAKHLLVDCNKYEPQRRPFLNPTSITQIFALVTQQVMVMFKFIYNTGLNKVIGKPFVFCFLLLLVSVQYRSSASEIVVTLNHTL